MTTIEPAEAASTAAQDHDLPWEVARQERQASVRRPAAPPMPQRASASPIPWTLAVLTIVTMTIAAYQSKDAPASHVMELVTAKAELAAR